MVQTEQKTNNRRARLRAAALAAMLAILAGCATPSAEAPAGRVSLSPDNWRADYEKYLALENRQFPYNPMASGSNGAVTTTYHSAAGRAGLEALQRGGTSVDAAVTTALTQIAEGAGAVISYFGVFTMVHYDAASGEIVTLNAGWNTIQGEDDPMSIPGGIDMNDLFKTFEPSGRTALVGGFMRGAEAAHARYGKLPWEALFDPAIYVAEEGIDLPPRTARSFAARDEAIRRLPETRATLVKADGSAYQAGDRFRQPALARTLRAIASQGADYMYTGPLAERIVAAVQADGGKMTMQDLADYEAIWSEPRRLQHNGYTVNMLGAPNGGSIAAMEALNLTSVAGIPESGHWSESAESFRNLSNIGMMGNLLYLTEEMLQQMYPGADMSPEARMTVGNAELLWQGIQKGVIPGAWSQKPSHSDTVVATDRWGNMTAVTHTINCLIWGSTAIVVDGITIGDPGAFQQAGIAAVGPGQRLPDPIQVGILTRDGEPELAFASMAMGLHWQTMQSLVNYMDFGMDVKQAVDAPAMFLPQMVSMNPPGSVMRVMEGTFPAEVVEQSGIPVQEIRGEERRFAQGLWIGISRDPATGMYRAASPPYATGMAFAY